MANRNHWAIGLSVAAIGWCLAAGYWMRATPMMAGERYPSLGEALGMIAVPVAGASAATWAAWRNRPVLLGLAAGLVGLFSFVTGFSIGAAFHPAVALLLWSLLASIASAPDRRSTSAAD